MTDQAFEDWLLRQEIASIEGLAACISPTSLTFSRPGFGQTVRPVPGSTVASPATDITPGEPDYFFHWFRDGALLFDAVAALYRQGDRSRDWAALYGDHTSFNLCLAQLDPGLLDYGDGVQPDFRQFFRPAEELAALAPEDVVGDVRTNPDGTLDFIRWSRPQHDGPALRALVALRFGIDSASAAELIRSDLAFTLRHLSEPSVDIWEEHLGEHYYTRLVQYAALLAGADWSAEPDEKREWRAAAERLRGRLDLCVDNGGFIWSVDRTDIKQLDSQIILAILHAGLPDGPHSVADPRALVTLERLEAAAAAAYPINQGTTGTALGRYIGDRYVAGGPWYITTFAAAEFRYRLAALQSSAQARRSLIEQADASMEAARQTIPASGALTEQFDPTDGHQCSARGLGWSHAAFLTALAARRRA